MNWTLASVLRRGFDLSVAAVLLIVLSPALPAIACAIRCSSPGPALFGQFRVGRDGRVFTMYKFRTMRAGAAQDHVLRELVTRELAGEDTRVQGSTKLAADRRITAVGRWLRRTSLDELPQLINVLRGEMSLVGPRPCLPWEAELFPPESWARFRVRPGMTGLWQVSGRSELTTPQMLRLDVEYVNGQRLRGDLAILCRTLPVVLRGRSSR